MSNKNAYEIRLEVLQMAAQLCQERTFQKNERLKENWNTQRELFFRKDTSTCPDFPELETTCQQDVLGLAKELLTFIDNSN